MDNEKQKKVGWLHSVVFKVMLCVALGVVLTWFVEVLMFIPLMETKQGENAENYMYDMAVSYGNMLDRDIMLEGSEQALSTDSLRQMFASVKIKCAESGYIYITDASGIMLYHPTAEKIGQAVENSVVQGAVSRLGMGNIPEPEIVTYDFKGVIKYASYYVGGEGSYVLVVTADEDEIMAASKTARTRGVVSGIVSLAFSLFVAYFAVKIVVRPVKQLAAEINRFASLDLTLNEMQKKLMTRKDEFGQISAALGNLHGALTRVVLQVRDEAEKLNEAAEFLRQNTADTSDTVAQVERAVGEIADGATNQAQETQKATENVILIGNMVEETSKQVEDLNRNTGVMQQASDEATDMLRQLGDTNIKTKEAIEKIYEQTNTTNESALKIREATAMITSIAEETNLLSLNASIEAARAGEQGRGFAVVASQIQKLAEQSNDSAGQIATIIDSLIRDSEEAVATMEQVKGIIAEQSINVEKTGEGYQAVQRGMDASLKSVENISHDIESLDEARVRVVDVVQNLTAIAEENAAGTEETSASVTEVSATIQNMAEQAERLKEVADQLERSVQIFKM